MENSRLKIRVKCIGKNRDAKGKIINYLLIDESGRKFTATSDEIKTEIKKQTYEFTNLQIDSIGRLVDKVDRESRESRESMEDKEALLVMDSSRPIEKKTVASPKPITSKPKSRTIEYMVNFKNKAMKLIRYINRFNKLKRMFER